MLLTNTFYQSYHFPPPKSKEQITTVRKLLLKALGKHHNNDNCSSDIQIKINNPRMYSKSRHIGSMHRTSQSFNSLDFKSFYDQCSKSVHASPNTDNHRLVKMSISRKKFEKSSDTVSDVSPVSRETINSVTDEIPLTRGFRFKGEAKDDKVKRAAQYLIKQGKFLKSYLKRETVPRELQRRLTSISKSFKLTENKLEVDEKASKSSKTSTGEAVENKRKAFSLKAEATVPYLMKITGDDIAFRKGQEKGNGESIPLISLATEGKRQVKQKKKRFHTTTATSSGLSFAEKMELLAIGRIIN